MDDKQQLKILQTISKLEVGPVIVEKNKITSFYKVTLPDGKEDQTELIYRFEEDIFEPNEPESINLATIITAQVALNYGLFCNEIIFHGPFDKIDQKFIEDMAKNTAKEIFVKKFLEPNPFLIGEAAKLPPIKLDSYLQAKLIFKEFKTSTEESSISQAKYQPWSTEQDKYTILSSGGKDSLLSFGLIKEINKDTHPIFINESGRHWFTALNAYRYFSLKIPNTARVWTNADRLYNWMLRHLPFIRQDYSNIRSDEYPIRLWTVAVFLFGALPIMRKRKIGNLIIGDEYDTTVKLSYKGITHYNGLYDQSRYFDNAMTKYFKQKAWNINQFSLLRPLSEMLIEKILVERYPDLQRVQVSCHATHTEGDYVRPCGNCEKCRRIIGMLKAISANPERCGYTSKQIIRALKQLSLKGVSQEKEGVQQLAFLLAQKGLIPTPSPGFKAFRERPEILKLRFDLDKSPIDNIPEQLREQLYSIFLEHANGAVKRVKGLWEEFDLINLLRSEYGEGLRPVEISPESELDVAKGLLKPSEELTVKIEPHILSSLTWPEAKDRFKEVDLALLPVGSIEQHGSHLPLDTDAFDADYLAKEVAKRCKDPKPLVLPLIPYGVSYHHEDFSGTISLSPESLSNMVYDVGMSVAKHGIKKLVIINGHGGNTPALQFAAQMINRDSSIFTCVETGETSDSDIGSLTETSNDVHAGEIETSTTFAIRPEMVRKDKIRKFVPRFSSRFLDFTSKRRVEWYARTVKISKSGVMGDPTKATQQKGEQMWELMIKPLVEFIEDLKNLSLEEIYQRRY